MVAAMSNQAGAGGTGDPADLARIRAEVESALSGFLGRQRSLLEGIGHDLAEAADAITDLVAGGKRLRPAFCYWGWRACGGTDLPAIFVAAGALELLHASALVHDDVIDASDTRRGRPSVHRRFAAAHAAEHWRGSPDAFGAGAAIIIGDLLLAWTDEMLRDCGLPAAAVSRGLGVLDAMRTEVLAGQFLDLTGQASASEALDSALTVIMYKSAKYTVERPLHLGAALAAVARPDVCAGLTHYGIPLGIAFQLRDDILGVFGDPARTGKSVTGDLRDGKRTVMLALAFERADERQSGVLGRSVGNPGLTEHAAEQVRSVITATGALAECEAMIDRHVKEALAALETAPITAESKTALAHLAVAATSRTE